MAIYLKFVFLIFVASALARKHEEYNDEFFSDDLDVLDEYDDHEEDTVRIKRLTPASPLSEAISKLVDNSNELSPVDVRRCLNDVEVCAEYGVESKSSAIGGKGSSHCGKSLVLEPFKYLTLNLESTGECVVDIVVRHLSHSKYFLKFEKTVANFGNCNENFLKINQGNYVQTYCNGDFVITEFPGQEDSAKITYLKKAGSATLSLRVTSDYVKAPKSQYREQLPRLDYSNEYGAHKILKEDSSELKTFDPKLARFQQCPLECGFRTSPNQKLPRSDLLKLQGEVSNPVDEEDFPWYVTIEVIFKDLARKEPKVFGGAIINSKTIITAANYFVLNGKTISKILVKTRPFITNSSSRMPGQTIEVLKTVTHPDFMVRNATYFDQMYEHDLAIMILKDPLRMGFESAPVCFGPHVDYWGNLVQTFRPETREGSTYLTEAYSIVWVADNCANHVNLSAKEKVFCHSYHDTFDTAENIGSPVMIQMRNEWFQIGVLSQYFTDPTFESGTVLRISTNLAHYRNFIQQHTYGAKSTRTSNLCY